MELNRHQKIMLIVGIAVSVTIAVFFFPPLPQNLHYHDFADQRGLLNIPNFWNVVTNFPFVLVGLLGIHLLVDGPLKGGIPELRRAYLYLFLGVLLVGAGSSYYHLHPSNETLLWDRMPLTLAIMAFVSIVVGEHISITAGRRLLWPLLLVGLASVVYWHATEAAGHGDLRPYFIVQFLPMALIPVVLLLFPSHFSKPGYFWAVLGAYAVAKILELEDGVVFHALGGFISGHSLKHLCAATGGYAFLMALQKRRLTEKAR
jgi:ceramidase